MSVRSSSKRRVIIFIIILLFAAFLEFVSWMGLRKFSSFLPDPSIKVMADSESAIDPYLYGCNTFDPKYGWNDFSGYPSRLGITELLDRMSEFHKTQTLTSRSGKQRFDLITLGDSFTYASEVAFHESWPFLITEGDSKKFSVKNMGTPGYGLDQAYLKGLYNALCEKPKYLALCIDFACIFRNLSRVNNFFDFFPGKPILKPRFMPSAKGLELLKIPFKSKSDYDSRLTLESIEKIAQKDGWYNFYKRYFEYDVVRGWSFPYTIDFIKFAKAVYKIRKSKGSINPTNIFEDLDLPENRQAYEITERLIKEFVSEAREAKILPVVFLLTDAPEDKSFRIKHICHGLSVPVLDVHSMLEQVFIKSEMPLNSAFFNGSGHYNVVTNSIVGQFVKYHLEREFKDTGRLSSFQPDLSRAFFKLYFSLFIRAVPELIVSAANMEKVWTPLLNDRMTHEQIRLFSEELLNIFSSVKGNFFKNDLYFSKRNLERLFKGLDLMLKTGPHKNETENIRLTSLALRSVPGWNRALEYPGSIKNKKNNGFLTAEGTAFLQRFKKALSLYKKGYEYLLKEDYSSGTQAFESAVRIMPEFTDAVFSYSLSLGNQYFKSPCDQILEKQILTAYYANASDIVRAEYIQYLFALLKSSAVAKFKGLSSGAVHSVGSGKKGERQLFYLLPDMISKMNIKVQESGNVQNGNMARDDQQNLPSAKSLFRIPFSFSDKKGFEQFLKEYTKYRSQIILKGLDQVL